MASIYRIQKALRRVLSGNNDLRFEILRAIGRLLLPRYRFHWPQIVWWDDASFNAYLSKFDELDGMNTDRRWMQYQLLRLIEGVLGDTAECGVYKGAASYLICASTQVAGALERAHHVFDSFAGLSEPDRQDGSYWSKGALSYAEEGVHEALKEFDVTIYKGWIPDRFSEIETRNFCFVHIDVDLYAPTRASLEFFYPRMSEGGIIICDDYGFSSCPGATLAVDEYLQDKSEKFISLSAGGGFLIKGHKTAS